MFPWKCWAAPAFPAIGELPYMITLAPYGFYWFQLQERDKSEHVAPSVVPEFETLVVPLGATWVSLARTRSVFERDVLPGHLARTRWYPERSAEAIHPTLTSAIPFCDIGDNRPWLAIFEATQRDVTTRYVLPMQIEWVRFDRERYNPNALAAVRQGAREGTLLDVATDHIFIALLLRNLREALNIEDNGMRLEFRPTSRFSDRQIKQPEQIRAVETDQFNSTALVDNDYVVKIFRKLESGINPEIETGRFLTEIADYANAPAMLGSVELVEGNTRNAIAVVHALVRKPGRRLGRDGGVSRPLSRGTASVDSKPASRRKRESRLPICVTCRRSEGAPPKCTSPSPPPADSPILRLNRFDRGCAAVDRRGRRARRTHLRCREAPPRCIQRRRSPACRPSAGTTRDACMTT